MRLSFSFYIFIFSVEVSALYSMDFFIRVKTEVFERKMGKTNDKSIEEFPKN